MAKSINFKISVFHRNFNERKKRVQESVKKTTNSLLTSIHIST